MQMLSALDAVHETRPVNANVKLTAPVAATNMLFFVKSVFDCIPLSDGSLPTSRTTDRDKPHFHRRHGEIVYSTSTSGVQSLLSVEKVLEHPKLTAILGEDLIFALDTILVERLGANLRNTVAHGIIDDGSAGSHDAAYLWWLALYILRAYVSDALETIQKDEA